MSSFFICNWLRKSRSTTSEFRSEKLFGYYRFGNTIGIPIEGFFLVLGVLPSDGLEAKLHHLAVEIEAFSDLH